MKKCLSIKARIAAAVVALAISSAALARGASDEALDRWLDGETIIFAPEEKAGELEQVMWGRG